MITVTMPATDAVTIAALIHLTDPKTPRLDTVHLSTLGGETKAVASDRYTLGTYYSRTTATDCVEWQLTAAACKFLTANVKPLNKWHTPENVTFEVDTSTNAFTIMTGAATYSDKWPTGVAGRSVVDTMSAVVTSWAPRTDAVQVRLGTRLLMKLGKLTDGFTKVDTWLIELGASNYAAVSDRPGPVMATSPGGVMVLIQPNLLK